MSWACGSLMTTGDHWRPLAQVLGTRSYTSGHYDTSGAPDSPPQDQGQAWMPSKKALGAFDRLRIWSMPPKCKHQVAPVLGTRSYVGTCERSPMGRPWSPMVAHRYQRVPGGARGFWLQWATMGDQGRPGATSGAAPRYALFLRVKCTPAVASGRPWSPMVAHRYQRVPEGARGFWLQWAHTGAHWQPVVTSGAGPRYALIRRYTPAGAHARP